MLIVGCQNCGETKVLAGAPDRDGTILAKWTCAKCGAGQVLEIEMGMDPAAAALGSLLGGSPGPSPKPGEFCDIEYADPGF